MWTIEGFGRYFFLVDSRLPGTMVLSRKRADAGRNTEKQKWHVALKVHAFSNKTEKMRDDHDDGGRQSTVDSRQTGNPGRVVRCTMQNATYRGDVSNGTSTWYKYLCLYLIFVWNASQDP